MEQYTIPKLPVENPNYGHRRAYSNTFEAKDTEDCLAGLLGELYALKSEGYEVVDIRIDRDFSSGLYKLIVVVENKDMFLR